MDMGKAADRIVKKIASECGITEKEAEDLFLLTLEYNIVVERIVDQAKFVLDLES